MADNADPFATGLFGWLTKDGDLDGFEWAGDAPTSTESRE